MPDTTQPTAFASWSGASGQWWPYDGPTPGLFEPSEPYSGRWPTSGTTRCGVAYRLPTSAHPMDGSGSSSSLGPLLPTPEAKLGANSGPDYARAGRPGSGGDDLTTTVHRLISTANLLPTPTAHDAKASGPSQVNRNSMMLSEIPHLLPSPRTADGVSGTPQQRGSKGDLMLAPAVLALFPTPTAASYGSNQSPTDGAAVRPGLDGLAPGLMPTPQARDGGNRGASRPERRKALNARRAGQLDEVAMALFPTPTASDATSSGGNDPANVTLTDAVIRTKLGTQPNPRHEPMMPTPTAADAERTSHAYPRGNSTLLGAATGAMPLLPTPGAADALGGHTSRSGDRKDEMLLPKIARSIGESTAQRSTDGSTS